MCFLSIVSDDWFIGASSCPCLMKNHVDSHFSRLCLISATFFLFLQLMIFIRKLFPKENSFKEGGEKICMQNYASFSSALWYDKALCLSSAFRKDLSNFPHHRLFLLWKYCKALKRHKKKFWASCFHCQLLLVDEGWKNSKFSFFILLWSNVSSIKINFVPLSFPLHICTMLQMIYDANGIFFAFFSFLCCSPYMN